MATGNLMPAYVNVLEIKMDMADGSYIQLVQFGHVKIQLVNGTLQFASVDIRIDQMSMTL